MQPSAEAGLPLPTYCSVARTLKATPPWDLSFSCPLALRAPCLPRHYTLTRNDSYHPGLHAADSAWQGLSQPGEAGDAAGNWVLARRNPDGFYYLAQIKATPEVERRGGLVVKFEAPLATGPKLPAQWHSIVLEEDVIRFSPSVAYSLQPGDKVLAPWGPDRQQYGPGTVLSGLERRGDSQRAPKEEEITVYFWNGVTAQVPLAGVKRVPLAVWRRAVDRLQKPCMQEHPEPLWPPCCSLLRPVPGCPTKGPPADPPFLCPSCHPHACCQRLYQRCLCRCPLAGPTWWPLTRTPAFTAREVPDSEREPKAQLLPLEGPNDEARAEYSPMAVPSLSSSSGEEEDSENNLETGLPQRPMVDRAVNTDPVLPVKPVRQRGPCPPPWRYWRRTGPEPRSGEARNKMF
ncbi:uncharacterized protein C11orf16 homolog [Perognathus longimembris pacificus]|uniref:uncharacterized protein C11orf16 homolog n=1 Tax=Perognathus longimembris pacificus TaxID=214514 RepID=UPI00201970D7|nr:uncharacterized protein C11orf16 homolog [Perognathus longimembris pacificus]